MEPVETNSIVPDDLFPSILSWLPVRDLLRFRCVSKSWRALIDDPNFIRTHYCVQYDMLKAHGDVPFLLWKHLGIVEEGYPLECYLLSKQQEDDSVSNLKFDLERDTNSIMPSDPDILFVIRCRGSANGIICLQFEGFDRKGLGRDFQSCGLWNPASREFKSIAYPHLPDQIAPGPSCCVRGFGFDCASNDFKIVATTAVESDIVLSYLVYSLSTNSWKRIREQLSLGSKASVHSSPIDSCLNGVYYWTASLLKNEKCIVQILSYNFSTEMFKFFDPPQKALPLELNNHGEFDFQIGLYNECLAIYFTRRVYELAEETCDIWVVTEFDDDVGVPLTWQCLISIKPIFERCGSIFGPLRMDGDLLISMYSLELGLYNSTTGKFRKLGINYHECFSYVESLFPLSTVVLR